MYRLLFILLILVNNFAFGQTNNAVALRIPSVPTKRMAAWNWTDTSSLKPGIKVTAEVIPVMVIIPSKMVCRQRVSTFFIVADNTKVAEKDSAVTGQPIFDLEAIPPGAGTDVLEMMLKTHGR